MSALDSTRDADNLPSISVVIPTQNNVALLSGCLQAVNLLEYPASLLEVVVVDNASTDRTRDMLARRFPNVQLVPLETNLGFAAACNKGAAVATGEYIAFLNNDAIADPQWLRAMLAAIEAGPVGTACAASRIVSRDGGEVEYDGAGSNLFAAGRPHSTWGWPGTPEPPRLGSPVLFASGGAMLVRRSVFLEAGGFDSEYFAYFEDVDFGWRLWLLGHAVAYAPDAVVRHIGGATGKRAGAHRRYTLWESNSLATVIKNYEAGNMERILSAALLLEYKRAFMAAGDAVDPRDYGLTAPKDTNKTNVERLPKVSVAHLAAIDRVTTMLPHLMSERSRIQPARQRTDAEILPLMGRLYEPQFAGKDYAEAAAKIASAIGLFEMSDPVVPPRVLLLCTQADEQDATALARSLGQRLSLAVASVDESLEPSPGPYAVHSVRPDSDLLQTFVQGADSVLAFSELARLDVVRNCDKPVAVLGLEVSGANLPRFDPSDVEGVLAWCLRRGIP